MPQSTARAAGGQRRWAKFGDDFTSPHTTLTDIETGANPTSAGLGGTLPTLPAGLYPLHPLDGFRIPAGRSNQLMARSPGSSTNVQSYEVNPPTS